MGDNIRGREDRDTITPQAGVDYGKAARTYDNTRAHSESVIERFASRVTLAPETSVLDFGCGTGNYLRRLKELFGCACYGVDPSMAMIERARPKIPGATMVQGDHRHVPFPNGMFEFCYLTDVVHHVPDLAAMFCELNRVAKESGRLCVVTESHTQISARFYNRYFPSMAKNEQHRYPDTPAIIQAAAGGGWRPMESDEIPSGPRIVSPEFLQNVEERNWSMFRLLSDDEYAAGLSELRNDAGRQFECPCAGATLLWFANAIPKLSRGCRSQT